MQGPLATAANGHWRRWYSTTAGMGSLQYEGIPETSRVSTGTPRHTPGHTTGIPTGMPQAVTRAQWSACGTTVPQALSLGACKTTGIQGPQAQGSSGIPRGGAQAEARGLSRAQHLDVA